MILSSLPWWALILAGILLGVVVWPRISSMLPY